MQNHADIANVYMKPFGTIFLNLRKFIVCPIVLTATLVSIGTAGVPCIDIMVTERILEENEEI